MSRILQFPPKHPISIDRTLTSVYNFQFDLFSTSTKNNTSIKNNRAKTRSRENFSSGYNDPSTLCNLIKASTNQPSLTCGVQAHSLVLKLGHNANPYLATALVTMYSEAHSLTDAHKVFDELPNRTAVCWTSLISAYERHGYPRRALELFRHMQLNNVEPDRVAITVAISACTDLGALDLGSWIYTYICRNWSKESILEDLILQNALINMYVKCGNVKAARCIFDMAKKRDVTTWTCMVMGYALHGPAVEALNIFYMMQKEFAPNHVTFLGALMACNHAGLVNEAWRYLESMEKNYGIKPKITHFGCMVDMLCRMGLLEEAYDLITDMPMKPNAMIW
ncbi:putative pentatricopeptide repeat-containing protein At1g74400 [Carex rostrata]